MYKRTRPIVGLALGISLLGLSLISMYFLVAWAGNVYGAWFGLYLVLKGVQEREPSRGLVRSFWVGVFLSSLILGVLIFLVTTKMYVTIGAMFAALGGGIIVIAALFDIAYVVELKKKIGEGANREKS